MKFLRLPAMLGVSAIALVALPVAGRAAPRPRPVAPSVVEIAVEPVAEARPAAYRLHAGLPERRTKRFSMVGVTWADDPRVTDVEVEVRVRSGGRWSGWQELHAEDDHAPDPGSPDDRAATRGGTAPLWVGEADGVQVRVAAGAGRPPRDVKVALVDPGTSDADRPVAPPPAAAYAATSRPSIVTRAQWGADERIRSGSPSYTPTILAGFVHHTDTSNTYSASQAAAMVRGVYAFHVRGRGWSDIGYNFLVDKYGRIYEGRAGGVDRPVLGAHTGGFNSRTFGVSLLGNYSATVPPAAMIGKLNHLLAWKLGLHHRNPTGRVTLTSAGSTRYAAGRAVSFNVISGHRDGSSTACPGTQTYARLPAIRSAVRTLMGASLVDPTVANAAPLYLSPVGPTVRASTLKPQSWHLTAYDAVTGVPYKRIYGGPATSVAATWDLRNANGVLAPPGRYKLVLESWASGSRSEPFVTYAEIRSPLTSGLAVRGPDGVVRLLVGRYAATPSPALAAALGLRPVAISAQQAASLVPLPAPIPDGGWYRTAGGAAYVVTGGVRRRVYPAQQSALGLPAPAVLPDDLWETLPVGTTWTDGSRHPDGMLVTDGTGTWRLESGVRRPVTAGPAFAALPGDLALPEGPALDEVAARIVRSGAAYFAIEAGTRRPLHPALAKGAVAATAADLALPVATMTAPRGLAGLGSDGVVRANVDGRLVELPGAATDGLPALEPADFGLALGGPLVTTARSPEGSLVSSGGTTWLVEGGVRRTIAPAVRATYAGRVVRPATQGDLALPVVNAGPPAHGSWVRTGDGATWLVESGFRRAVSPAVARRLGLDALAAYPMSVDELSYSTWLGAAAL